MKEAGKICNEKKMPDLEDALYIDGKIMATNGLIDLNVEIKMEVEDNMMMESFLFPAARVAGVVGLLPEESHLSWERKGGKIYLRCLETGTKVSWMVKNTERYPITGKERVVKNGEIDAKTLLKIMAFVESAQSQRSNKISLTGQYWEMRSGEVKVTATDGSRLAQAWGDMESGGKNYGCVVPGANIPFILQRLKESEGAVEVLTGKGQLILRQENWEIISRLIDDEFVDYGKSLPKEVKGLKINREEMMIGVKIGDEATTTDRVQIEIKSRDQIMEMLARSSETGRESLTQIKIEEAADIHEPILMNRKFLMDALKSCAGEKISIEMERTRDKPSMKISDVENGGWFYLIAQVRKTE